VSTNPDAHGARLQGLRWKLQPPAHPTHLRAPEAPARKGGGGSLLRRGDPDRDRRERPWPGHVHRPVHLAAGERPHHGAADHVRRAQARLRTVDHRGHPLLRLRAAGPEGRPPDADHRQAGGGPARVRRRHSRRVHGHARGADPGLLPHPVGPPLRLAAVPRGHPAQLPFHRRAGSGLPRRRRRGTGARLLQAFERLAGHRRQAPDPCQRVGGDEPHRRREGKGRGADRRHGGHRGNAHPGSPGAEERGSPAGGRVRGAPHPLRASGEADPGVGPGGSTRATP